MPIAMNTINTTSAGSINGAGGVYKYGPVAMAFISFTLVLSLITLSKKVYRAIFPSELYLLLGGAIFTTALIGVYQIISIGHFEYYYYKSLYLLVVIGVIFCASLMSHVPVPDNKFVTPKHLNIYLLLIACWVIYLIKPTYPIVYVNNWFHHTILPTTLDKAITLHDDNMARDTLLISCDSTREYIADRWTGALFLSENQVRNKLETNRFYGVIDEDKVLNYSQNKQGVSIIYDSCP
jgi:hypothetical protein